MKDDAFDTKTYKNESRNHMFLFIDKEFYELTIQIEIEKMGSIFRKPFHLSCTGINVLSSFRYVNSNEHFIFLLCEKKTCLKPLNELLLIKKIIKYLIVFNLKKIIFK